MMSAMDDAVGQVLAKVREMGQEENTLIFFLSDNGGPTQQTTSKNGPLRGFKATTLEGGVRVPFCVQWKGKIPAGKTYDHPIIQLDILPTALAAAGGKVDPAWKLDGVDLLPYLTGKNTGKPHETLYWRFGEQWAIRHGDWKLVVAQRRQRQAASCSTWRTTSASRRTWPRRSRRRSKELQAPLGQVERRAGRAARRQGSPRHQEGRHQEGRRRAARKAAKKAARAKADE